MGPYRAQATRDEYEDENMRTERVWLGLLTRVALMLQGPIVAGLMHDVCTPAHEGVCWAVGITSVLVSSLTFILSAV